MSHDVLDDDRTRAGTWVELLSPESCWDLMSTVEVGRLGVLVDSAPEVYPVNFVVVEETVVFRTDEGTKHRGLDRSPSVCFEVDVISDVNHTGWSVMIKGRAVEVTDVARLAFAEALDLHPWSVGTGTQWIRIVPREITGRRIGYR